ncbi:hypothetical protein KUV57_12830 [Epibacterium sp. DP7N7-1]|nr:hypothetical protein [Epibacterium sp. DP7N7-1]
MARNPNRKPFFSRVGRWGLSRIRRPDLIERSAHNVQGATNSALGAVKPADFDKNEFLAGYRGRHSDGGKARFQEMIKSKQINVEQLTFLRKQHLRFALIFVLSAGSSLLYGMYMMFTAVELLGVFGGGAVASLFFAFMALALRHDFSAWQLKARRFGGFSEYLETRL